MFRDFSQAKYDEHVRYEIRVAYPCTLSDSGLVIPGNFVVILQKDFTVPENFIMTNHGTIRAHSDVVMTVNGTIINNNFIEMEKRTAATGAMLRINGNYRGAGSLGVKDQNDPDSYFTGIDLQAYSRQTDNIGNRYFFNMKPDLSLPASLNVIGEEAFAGCAFIFPALPDTTETIRSRAFADCPNLAYIHIPAATTSIADDAFDGAVGLTIFCFAGSEAERFARDHGINYRTIG